MSKFSIFNFSHKGTRFFTKGTRVVARRKPSQFSKMRSTGALRYSMGSWYRNDSGFTMVEMLVVFAILVIGSTAGIASFKRFGEAKKLDVAASEVESSLNNARINAVTQTLPQSVVPCTEPLPPVPPPPVNLQYIVSITSATAYEMDVFYNGVCSRVKAGKLPTGVTFTLVPNLIYFLTSTGTSPAGGSVTLNGAYGSKQIIIDTAGNITKL